MIMIIITITVIIHNMSLMPYAIDIRYVCT